MKRLGSALAKFKIWMDCHFFGFHVWTTDFLERGETMDMEEVKKIGYATAFKRDTTMFCKHCKKLSEIQYPNPFE